MPLPRRGTPVEHLSMHSDQRVNADPYLMLGEFGFAELRVASELGDSRKEDSRFN